MDILVAPFSEETIYSLTLSCIVPNVLRIWIAIDNLNWVWNIFQNSIRNEPLLVRLEPQMKWKYKVIANSKHVTIFHIIHRNKRPEIGQLGWILFATFCQFSIYNENPTKWTKTYNLFVFTRNWKHLHCSNPSNCESIQRFNHRLQCLFGCW